MTHKFDEFVTKAPWVPRAIMLAIGLAGCMADRQAPAPAARLDPSPLQGRPFDVVAGESRLTVLAYRAGPLAAFGHNHVIACRCLTGTLYLPRDPLRAGFDLRVAVRQLTVDDPAMRAAQHSADFPPNVSQSARQAVRHNMLGTALLNAARYPDITLRSESLRPSPDGKRDDVIAQVLVQVAGEMRSIAVPMHYEVRADEIVASGEFALKLTDLGRVPFSTLGGALRVRDGMKVRLRLTARGRSRAAKPPGH